jgi:hypothetical protein
MFVFRLIHAAEADEGLAAGFGRREPTLKVFFDGQLKMGGDLGFEIGVELRLPEERTHAALGSPQGAH